MGIQAEFDLLLRGQGGSKPDGSGARSRPVEGVGNCTPSGDSGRMIPTRQTLCRRQSEPSPACAGGSARVALEEFAEKGVVLKTDRVTDLLHGEMVTLEQALGGRDPKLLQADRPAISSGLLKAANGREGALLWSSESSRALAPGANR
jgi:hypothetical protein